jgi:site-specific DNA-methyltransferase (adenine-specific)
MNRLLFGDNLQWLRDAKLFPDASVDLVYLDPPFKSDADYNVLFREASGEASQAQFHAFTDTWNWADAAQTYAEFVDNCPNTAVVEMMEALHGFLKNSPMMAYLAMMAPRLVELHRVLKPTGSLYLHCDPTASHYLRMLLDGIFGQQNFLNEIIWKRTSAHSSAKRYGPVHDVILFYGKSDDVKWIGGYEKYGEDYIKERFKRGDDRPWKDADITGSGTRNGETGGVWRGFDVTAKGRHWAFPPSELDKMDTEGKIYWPTKKGGWPRLKKYLDEAAGVPLQDVWSDIFPINSQAIERLGYPTQKPQTLLERIISASTDKAGRRLQDFIPLPLRLDSFASWR